MNKPPQRKVKEKSHKHKWEQIKCAIGYHSWQWTLLRDGNRTEPVTGIIPARAICGHCGVRYGIN